MNFEGEARDEVFRRKLIQDWVRLRVDNIHARITAYDVLAQHQVMVPTPDREHQISCPFHGQDAHPSARYYPETPGSRSHVWCFYCRKSWDVIGLWREFHGQDVPFTRTLLEIEKAFGLETPEMPRLPSRPKVDPNLKRYQTLAEACESRLVAEKANFDMRSYFILCVLLDRVYGAVASNRVTAAQGCERLRKILDKIGEKVRCPAG